VVEEVDMDDSIFVLLVCNDPGPSKSLKESLKNLKVPIHCVRSCIEAWQVIRRNPPQIVFTGTALPDGTWLDVIGLAGKASIPPNVVVVGSKYDLNLYLHSLARGAFDFLFPPFVDASLDFVVQSAASDVRHRRQARLRVAEA
jgi:DNA-binding NtrC family response regulator